MIVVSLRDRLAAKHGFLRARHIAIITAAPVHKVYYWGVKAKDVQGRKYFNWAEIRARFTPGAIEILDLPADATVALERAEALDTEGQLLHSREAWYPNPDERCGDPHPNDPHLVCTRHVRHKSFHCTRFYDGSTSSVWGPTYTTMQRTNANRAQKLRERGSIHPHASEADVINPEHPNLPHMDIRSKYMGRPIKLTQDKIDELVEYSWRIPKVTTMQGLKWKANRNILQPHGPKEWWQGEHITSEGELEIRWCCIQLDIQHPEKVLPAYTEGAPITEDQFIDPGPKK